LGNIQYNIYIKKFYFLEQRRGVGRINETFPPQIVETIKVSKKITKIFTVQCHSDNMELSNNYFE